MKPFDIRITIIGGYALNEDKNYMTRCVLQWVKHSNT
jgi:hypothetical protein